MDAADGVSTRDSMTAEVTYTVAVVVCPPKLAVIVTGFPLLFAMPVTMPVLGSMVASVESEDDHVALLIVCVVLSL